MLDYRAAHGQLQNLPESFSSINPPSSYLTKLSFPRIISTMVTLTNPTTTLFQPKLTTTHHQSPPIIRATISGEETLPTTRRKIVTTLLTTTSISLLGVLNVTPLALADYIKPTPLALADYPKQKWGTRSFLRERFFSPDLSPEDAAARIRQTAEGLRSIRNMLETKSWRYVLFYVRLKMAYLSKDMTNAMSTIPEGRKKSYVKTANELVENLSQLDNYVRTPKIYESYLYYEKTLKSIDELVVML